MVEGDQSETVALLSAPVLDGEAGPVERIDTHISRIFLRGRRAWKIKRAVRLPYVDFSSAEARLAACEEEVRLNSVTAPEIYRACHRVTRRADGALALGGDGPLVDAVVEMTRFDQETLFDRMATAGRLSAELMTRTALAIARFHAAAPVRDTDGAAAMAQVLAINAASLRESALFTPADEDRFTDAFEAALRSRRDRLSARGAAGRVRRCHGDLHLRNICLVGGEPRLFDCIDFSPVLATVDVLYDLAFLLMDLIHRNLGGLAATVANRYLDATGDEAGFGLLPFFMAVRAGVRAHVAATAAGGEPHAAPAAEARSYFRLALALLEPAPPRLVAVGGLSGSGKSTLAEAVSAGVGTAPGARVLESDRIRKSLFDVAAETRLPPEAYRPEVSERVYVAIAHRAAAVLASGGSVVANAVFDRPEDRARIAAVAREASVPFDGFWLAGGPALLAARVAGRRKGPSDADVAVLERQIAGMAGPVEWRTLDAATPPGDLRAELLGALGGTGGGGGDEVEGKEEE